jgi:hypothetical protein
MDANGRQRVATRIGLAQLDGRECLRVATRSGLALLNGRDCQRVAARSGPAQPVWTRMAAVATRIGLA